MKALILAAGRGKNLIPLTETRPKPMIPLCGKPILDYIIEGLIETGNRDIIMVVGHQSEKIRNYYKNGEEFGVSIQYIENKEHNGIGNAILSTEDKFVPGEHFFLVYADILFESNIFSDTLATYNSKLAPVASITLTPKIHPYYGNVSIDQSIGITKIVNQLEEAQGGSYVLAGVFIFDYTLFKTLKESGRSMHKSFGPLVEKERLFGSIFEHEWIDLGYPWNVLDANRLKMNSFKKANIDGTVQMEGNCSVIGPAVIEKNVTLSSGSVIKGPCYIGEGTYIGNNVLVRPNTSIGANCIIGYGVELKNCVLFDSVEVGRLSCVADSVVGENVDLGTGIITVNHTQEDEIINLKINDKIIKSGLTKLGSFIGDQAKVGARNTLAPGTIISAKQTIPHNIS